MTIRRFYAPSAAFDIANARATLDASEARHLKDVLRLRVGDEVLVFDGEGREFKASIEEISAQQIRLHLLEEAPPSSPESPVEITLALALLKGEKLDLVIQKATELGIAKVLLFTSEHADVKVRTRADGIQRIDRLERIALEAAKQSGRAKVPVIEGPFTLQELLSSTTAAHRLLFSERNGEPLDELTKPREGADIIFVIGPEGGWADSELEAARTAGWTVVTLGGRVLRAETAAIAVLAVLQNLFGDLN
jgi:16S rRNA (uracil1498-N3)-methyltransferase